MNILITGSAGFIGSHLAEKLLNEKHEIIGLDNFDPFYDPKIKKENIAIALKNPRYAFIPGDIRDQKLLAKIFSKHHFDCVIHLAAKVGVIPSLSRPAEYFEINVQGALNILEKARSHKIKKIILASSSSVYGANLKIPFSEKDPTDRPLSPYAASKKAMEILAFTFHKLYKMDIAILRFFTVYGPRQRPDMAIHKFTRLISQGKIIPLYGQGKTERDYTYIDDIIQGIVNTIKYHRKFEIYNLGTDQPIDALRLARLLEKTLNKKAKIKKMPAQDGDLPRTWADITKAKKILRYHPQTEIEIGTKKFVEWCKKR
ncbi:epimerase [bacterium (Candidatus Torokbacteria) CG09_land_8_20_14_0_10_42_11]|nr:MAG: epimerase [bacterium (Candidatus Torokbacteria) CG09_land_8_20_14_0_10_42_11]